MVFILENEKNLGKYIKLLENSKTEKCIFYQFLSTNQCWKENKITNTIYILYLDNTIKPLLVTWWQYLRENYAAIVYIPHPPNKKYINKET